MAENRVEIVVVSRNDTKAGFDQAKRDAEKAGDDAGKSFMSKFGSWLSGSQTKGLFGNPGAGGGIGGVFSTIFSAGAPGIAALAAVVGSLLVEIDGVVAGFTAMTAGAGAFAALALPAFKILQTNYTQLVTNQNDFQAASANIAIAIQASAKNAAQYKQTIADPEFRRAVLLLNDQNTVWQNLTVSQQNSLVALDNNKTMLKTLLPAQKDALGVLMKEQDAWNNLTPSQQQAAGALDNIRTAYNKMSLAFQPVAFKIFGQALQVVVDLMPKLLPLANAFGTALGGLLTKLDQFVQSKGFQQWFQQFLAYVGPATSAVGKGLGEVAISFGKLLTVLPPADVVRSIGIAFGTVKYALDALTISVRASIEPFTLLAQLVTFLGGANLQGLGSGLPSIASIPKSVGNVNYGGVAALRGYAPGPVANLPHQLKTRGFASGGTAPGGLAVVGEYGPELVDLPAGSYVHPAGTGGGGTQIVMHWGSPQTQALVRALWPGLMLEVRNRGGGGPQSAQIALGQTH